MRTRPPSLAAAHAWFAPLPPGCVANFPPSTVSPGRGRRSTCTTKSMFRLPTTVIAPRIDGLLYLPMTCSGCGAPNADDALACSECGLPVQPQPVLGPGFLLAGRYQIVRVLGRGGMGTVYEARDRLLEETVAIKALRPEAAASADVAQRFRAEIKLARAVSHKNVCRIHEYGEDRGIRYISMAYVDGIDLKRVLRQRGPLPPADAFDAVDPRRPRAAGDPRRGHRPPRPEDSQHHDRRPRRRAPDGLRHRQAGAGRRAEHDRHRPDPRHARVHEPRADPRPTARQPQRPLRAGGRRLRGVHGGHAVPSRDAARHRSQAPERAASARGAAGGAAAARARAGAAQGARQEARRTLRERQRDGPGARGGACRDSVRDRAGCAHARGADGSRRDDGVHACRRRPRCLARPARPRLASRPRRRAPDGGAASASPPGSRACASLRPALRGSPCGRLRPRRGSRTARRS